MTLYPPWSVLGLEPTADEAAIKRAYAAKLKTTNPEDDPEGFKALRAAYEQAQWRARSGLLTEDDHWDEEDAFEASPDEPGAPSFEPPSPPEPAQQPVQKPAQPWGEARSSDPIADHNRACDALAEAVASKAPPERLKAALQNVLRCEAMEQIDIYARTEGWLAQMVLSARPNSDPLLEPLIAHFRWEDRPETWDSSPIARTMESLRAAIAAERERDAFLARVADKRHEFHRAWKRLQTPVRALTPQAEFWARIWSLLILPPVVRFLQHLRLKQPHALAQIDAESVVWWEDRARAHDRFALARLGLVVFLFVPFLLVGSVLLAPPRTDIVEAPAVPSMDAPPWAQSGALDPSQSYATCRVAIEAALSARHLRGLQETCAQDEAAGATCAPVDPALDMGVARNSCRTALAQRPDSLRLRMLLGVGALKAEDIPQARLQFEAIQEVSPLDPGARLGLGLVARLEGKEAAARRLIGEAVALDPAAASFFEEFGFVASPHDQTPKPRLPPRLLEPGPAVDFAPTLRSPITQQQFDEAFAYVGDVGPAATTVAVRCLVSAKRVVSDCVVLSETPWGGGLSDVALRLARTTEMLPAERGPNDIDAPYVFRFKFLGAQDSAPAAPAPETPSLLDRPPFGRQFDPPKTPTTEPAAP